jgi:hypothetical protein
LKQEGNYGTEIGSRFIFREKLRVMNNPISSDRRFTVYFTDPN